MTGKECSCDEDVCRCFSPEDIRRNRFIAECQALGINIANVGTHSYRKGSASAAASGSTAAPSITVICIRAGWKISTVLNKYLSMEHAGDHFVGRVASGLPLLKKEFCVLLPYFRADLPDAQSILIEETYKNVFPNDTLWGDHMRAICMHLFAVLCYQKPYLDQLPPTHIWHSSYLAQNPMEFNVLHSLVELHCDGDHPDARFYVQPDILEQID